MTEPPAGLRGRLGQWVEVRGKVQDFRPLCAGAAWGEGTLVLPDATRVALSAPVGLANDADVALVARVTADGEGVRLVVSPP